MEEARVSLGTTGIRISPLGIGTWAWGDKLVWGYGKGYSDADIEAAYRVCIENGVNFFDTAEIYGWGRSERLLGRFIHRYEYPVVVATKFFPYPWRILKGALPRALQGSLRRLGVEVVDLYQIHWPYPPRSIETWVDILGQVAQAGRVKAVGVSNYSVEQMKRARQVLEKYGVPLASNQVQFNLLHREPETTGLLSLCQEWGITLIAYSPLAMGILTGKYSTQTPPPGARGRRYNRERLRRIEPLLHLLREIGESHGKTPAQVALNWVICKGAVPIVGAKNERQALENIGALGWRLAPEEVAVLDKESIRVMEE